MVAHTVTNDNSVWILVACSQEPRHLFDIVFQVDALRKRGINNKNIFVFVDAAQQSTHLTPHGITALPLTSLHTTIASLPKYDYAFLAAGGHGSFVGLSDGSGTIVRPAALIAALRACPGIKRGVLILGQCFGGTFNLVDAINPRPELVLVAATNLHTSLSIPLQIAAPIAETTGTGVLDSWLANVFLLNLFHWFRAPKDIDGDGTATLADAFRYAGAVTNQQVRDAKTGVYVIAGEVRDKIMKLQRKKKKTSNDQLLSQALARDLQKHLEILYSHQEPWLMNATLARDVAF